MTEDDEIAVVRDDRTSEDDEIVEAMARAMAEDSESELAFWKGNNGRGWTVLAEVALRAYRERMVML